MDAYRADRSAEPTVDAKRLWAGGAATALVAGLTAAVGLLLVRDVLGIPVITSALQLGNSQVTTIVGHAIVAALIATALLHLLILTTPRATTFFGWICILATITAALWPFTVSATLAAKIGSGTIHLVVGIAIYSLLSGVAATATRPGRPGR
ncbi:DUF6069 family protein [Rhodococcus phenolicus]|uniref:DUF6069 family protein n=1 Tax=Rhodococcus phenolicus TaxID=263849 RepID=UPI00082BB4FB|nr:DUF6069 family protein [Rhodococcus phenolicus]